MLKTRIITAIILSSFFVVALWLAPRWLWQGLVSALILLAGFEWVALLGLSRLAQVLFLTALGALSGLGVYTMAHGLGQDSVQALVMKTALQTAQWIWLLIVPLWLGLQPGLTKLVRRGLLALIGIVVLGSAGFWLMVWQEDRTILLTLVATVCVADSVAYFVGQRFGRHALAPSLSPKKTWEGLLGALLAVSILAFGWAFLTDVTTGMQLVLCAWLVVYLSVIGDLFESFLKRQAAVKDSGQLLPGHGGILDRIDGWLPVLAFSPLLALAVEMLKS